MSDNELPSPELLRQLLRYEPETGKLYWLPRPKEMFKTANAETTWNKRYADQEAFTANDARCYKIGSVFKTLYKAHRVAWCLHYGEWPSEQIDHINGVPSDNRICNLRQVTPQENSRNIRSHAKSSSSYLGVSFNKRDLRWRARIFVAGRELHLGSFQQEKEAAKAYDNAALKHFPGFCRLNFPQADYSKGR